MSHATYSLCEWATVISKQYINDKQTIHHMLHTYICTCTHTYIYNADMPKLSATPQSLTKEKNSYQTIHSYMHAFMNTHTHTH
jgi:hypothetical protein